MTKDKQIEERSDLAMIVDTAIREYRNRRYACNDEEGLVSVKELLADSIAAAGRANGYRKQVEGEWHWISDDDVMCTACGWVFNSNDNVDAGLSSWRFCLHCGAKIKGEEQ